MSTHNPVSQQRVDLTNCDREPIHLPGSIQPHGCLLACDAAARTVLRHSANAAAMLGLAEEPGARPLDDAIGAEAVHAIRNALSRTNDAGRPALMFARPLQSGRLYDIAVHRYKSAVILEFEPAKPDIAQPLELARTMIGRITATDSAARLVRDTARLIRAMLGYDRVMVYQFAHDGAGTVVSESKRADLESFLGQYFPATDIPKQARELYLRNTIRIISDVDFQRIPVVPELDASGEPLDLSFAHLRSVSPIHCEYLRNMGVGASMSISVVVDGALWGLIACHHYSARTLSMAERVAAEMFGEFFSLHLNALKQKQSLEAATRARASLDRFLRLTAQATDIDEVLRDNLPDFAALIPCDGAGLWLRGRWSGFATTPPADQIPALATFASSVAEGRVWATHNLSNQLPAAQSFAADAAGLLVIPLSQRPRDYLFFFRKELVHTLDWAGNPDKSYETGPLGDRLTPRKSFAIWKETVHQQSAPWVDEEREIAEATRTALVEVVLHQNEMLEDERAKADVRQRMLNEELNHRVKNILAVIKSLVGAPGKDGQTLEGYVASLRGRIQALAFAHDQVVRGDGGGALLDLVNAELTPYRDARTSIVIEGPPVWLDTRAFSVMALMLHELSTNAAKYGALSRAGGVLTIRWSFSGITGCDIQWTERGGPPVTPPQRRGFGTLLIDRSIPFDLGGESDVQYLAEGVHARFRIPAKFVSARSVSTDAPVRATDAPQKAQSLRSAPAATRVLIVEDQMLIAMHLEQILYDSGIRTVQTAASVAEALDCLARSTPNVAVLDINLGEETSEAVAGALKSQGIPFVFATGYDDSNVPARFSGVPIVRKPYEAASIMAALTKMLGRN